MKKLKAEKINAEKIEVQKVKKTQCITEWLSKKQSENEILKL